MNDIKQIATHKNNVGGNMEGPHLIVSSNTTENTTCGIHDRTDADLKVVKLEHIYNKNQKNTQAQMYQED